MQQKVTQVLSMALFLLILICGEAGSLNAAESLKGSRPNILLLLADDLGYADLSCYGARHSKTPNLDQLAKEGLRLTSFYAAAPNCSPSRSGLMTGRVPARTGMYNYIPENGPLYLPESEITIAELLRDQGYDTAHIGKWHLCHDLLNPDLPQPIDHGFRYSLGTFNNASPSHLNPVNFVRNGVAAGRIEGYSCEILASEALQWISKDRTSDQPFFLAVWFHETHTPLASPQDLISRHSGSDPEDALYYANVENLDRAVGRILKGLDSLGLAEETLVVFSSDNGGLRDESNIPLRGKKSFVWEGGIREPGILRWPGRIGKAMVVDEPSGLVDLLPTFCELAGAPIPNDRPIDGVSLLPMIQGRKLDRKTPLFWFFYRVEPAAALRDGDWVIVGWLEGKVPVSHPLSEAQMVWLKQARLSRFELYNVTKDISQREDLSRKEPERFARMQKQIIQKHAEVIAEGPVWEFPAQ